MTSRKKGRCHLIKEKGANKKNSPPKQAGLGKVAISPRGGWSLKSLKVAKSCQWAMCGDHLTSADIEGQSRHFPANSLMSGFSKKPFLSN
jgi:hypothetical protein